ncbi:Heme-degrading monooxygenase HmoA [Streptomyces sp. 3213]|uniref:antibiotic biosynthesis monooxygenase family protein n=1 Tax=Streptomyces sp. 3213.3 TaxID=1855348 RepID=UPI00089CECED|nr:antibiotic biosynthesis monooxygenase family protein [Streptomyces sp. 3213.3]SEF04335.1 Heme-degrading monooxygenase HmoA [Streptomyces sp. 3213] [Streptomyces sp. 3213.3]
MIEIGDLDRSAPYLARLQGSDDGQSVTLINTFVVLEGEIDKALDTWRRDSTVMRTKPGFISTQLHRSIGDSRVLTNVAVRESLTALRNAFSSEEFQSLLPLYPDGSIAYPVVVRKVAVPGVCVA